jgi:hypothetical protein
MRDIYRRVFSAVVWLGPCAHPPERVFKLIDMLSAAHEHPDFQPLLWKEELDISNFDHSSFS